MRKIRNDSVLHFPLAPLVSFDSSLLFKDTKYLQADSFIVALALVYNDCKDLLHQWEVLQEFRPKPPKKGVSAQFGQFCGMMGHCFRQQVGLLNGLLELLDKNRRRLSSPILNEAISALSGKARDGWSELEALAASESIPPKLKPIRSLITLIRNKGSHHYDTDVLKSGYVAHFGQSGPEHERAYISYGKNLEESRFYFADAAITGYHDRKMNKVDPSFHNTLAKYLRGLHPALRGLIGRYLRIRSKIPQ